MREKQPPLYVGNTQIDLDSIEIHFRAGYFYNGKDFLNRRKGIVKVQDTNGVLVEVIDGWTIEGATPTANTCIRAAIKTLKEAQRQLKEIIKAEEVS